MQKIKLLLFSFCFVHIIHAQTKCSEAFLGTKTLYTNLSAAYTKMPSGYNIVFINYAGRHGARHLTKQVTASYLYEVVNKADSLHQLTTNGEKLKKMILLLDKIEKDKVKSISYEGEEELIKIAERLFQNNTAVFNQSPAIKVSVTKEQRTEQSADVFIKGLQKHIAVNIVERKIDDANLRFYDFSTAYDDYKKSGSWIDSLNKLKTNIRYNIITKNICSRFFSVDFIRKFNVNEEKVVSDILGFAAIVYSLQKEIKDAGLHFAEVDFASLLTCEELKLLGKIDDVEENLNKGPAFNNDGIQVTIAKPLLANFLNTTEEYIQSKKVNVQLRFCHAETIAPFAALMNIKNAAVVSKNINEISSAWTSANIIPLSANIQWLLYYNSNTNNYLVKFLLNEKEVAIAELDTKVFPYYQWSDVRSFYNKKISFLSSK
jgi:hypothetical protein